MTWRIHHRDETASTNVDARAGRPGDVFTAGRQTAGRGRLDHVWLSAPDQNLLASAVLDVAGLPPDEVATLPLAVGLAVVKALGRFRLSAPLALKWPNDVLVGGRKICGILCERRGDVVIAGLGVNVNQTDFAPEIADRATSLRRLGVETDVMAVRDLVLAALDEVCATWRRKGFAALWPQLASVDALKGRTVSVWRTDDDPAPACGVCGGIRPDGSLDVAGEAIYAGEVHVRWACGRLAEPDADRAESLRRRTWYVLHVKPRTEKKVAEFLSALHVFRYVPLFRKVTKVQRRRVVRELPVFPGYVFTRLFPDERRSVLETRQIVRTIEVSRPRQMIHQLRQVEHAGRLPSDLRVVQSFAAGERVRVVSGPLRGLEGLVVRHGAETKLILSVDILGRALEASVQPADLQKLS